MSEPTKEALELARVIDVFADNSFQNEGRILGAAIMIDAHTASLREELRAAREADFVRDPAYEYFVTDSEKIAALPRRPSDEMLNTRWSKSNWKKTEMHDGFSKMCYHIYRRKLARAACKGGDAV